MESFSFLYKKYMQFYTDNYSGGPSENKDGGAETRKFFLNCLCLLLGRLDSKKFESIVSEYGMRISQVLLPQVLMLASNLDINGLMVASNLGIIGTVR